MYHQQPDSTLEKLYKAIKRLYISEDELFTTLEHAGCDTLTKYTPERLALYDNLRDLKKSLSELLSNHNNTIMDLEFELGHPYQPDFNDINTISRLAGL